jgi:hypothetical protein
MGFFSNIVRSVGETFNDIGSGAEDVFASVERTIFGSDSDRGSRIGSLIGSELGPIGSLVGQAVGSDISERVSTSERREITADDVSGVTTEADYVNMQNLRDQIDMAAQQPTITPGQYFDSREVLTAGFPAIIGGSVVRQAQNVPPFVTGAVVGGAMDFIEQATDYFMGGDQEATQRMMMCKPASRRAYTIDARTGCISITRKQQQQLKELVRNVGIEIASKQIGLSVAMVTQLLLKTFRTRRRGISGADLRTVKRVDRQMHSLACALGGISTTSRAVAARKSPPARKC